MAKIKVAGIQEMLEIPGAEARRIKNDLESGALRKDEYVDLGNWSGQAREIKSFLFDDAGPEKRFPGDYDTEFLKNYAGQLWKSYLEHKQKNIETEKQWCERNKVTGIKEQYGIIYDFVFMPNYEKYRACRELYGRYEYALSCVAKP